MKYTAKVTLKFEVDATSKRIAEYVMRSYNGGTTGRVITGSTETADWTLRGVERVHVYKPRKKLCK
jgi:hypothetical protein